jgi:hypothetical protein
MKPPMRQMLVRVPQEMFSALDAERRLYLDIPPRNVVVRELLGEALGFRRAMRPRTSGPARGKQPFEIDLSDWPEEL